MGPSSARTSYVPGWSGLTIGDARRGVEIAGSALRAEDIGGQTYWVPDGAQEPVTETRSAHLLPNYDEYFIGYRDRSATAQTVRGAKVDSGNAAFMAHVVVLDGQLVGGWKRTFQKKAVRVELNPVLHLSVADRRLIAEAVERFGAFVGLPVELAVAGRGSKLSSSRASARRKQ